jgi:hypothetical protein
MAIIKQFDKRSGITYVYDSKSYYDKEKKCSRAKRTLIGKIDPDTGEMIPTDGRNKGAKSKSKTPSPDIDKDKRIQELEDENRQLKLQISALKKELARLSHSSGR